MLKISEIDLQEKPGRSFKLLLLLYSAAIVFIKNTQLFAHPRFWAEEGKVYFKYAFEHSFLKALIEPHIDYYALVPNLATAIAAHFVPLEKAPLITTIFAFICQIIPVSIVVFGGFEYWNSKFRKIVIALLIITVAEPEIWLNTINSQFFLGLAAILIFFETGFQTELKFKWAYIFLLFLSGMTGPICGFILPLFLVRYLQNKNPIFGIYTFALLMTTALQASLFFYFHFFQDAAVQRFGVFDIKLVFEGFFAQYFSLIKLMSTNDKKNVGIVIFIYFIAILISSIKKKNTVKNYLIFIFVLISLLSLAGAVNMVAGTRYAYIPTFLLCVLIYSDVIITNEVLPKFRKYISLTLVIITFTTYVFFYQYDRTKQFEGPLWKTEVQEWKNNSGKPLKIYPVGWEFQLKSAENE